MTLVKEITMRKFHQLISTFHISRTMVANADLICDILSKRIDVCLAKVLDGRKLVEVV